MKIGTRSVLFGVHQFLFHPFTVVLAWRSLYKRWPHWWELVAIFCHDLGYTGLPNLDGPEGQQHPRRGANLTTKVVFKLGYWLRRLKGYSKDAASFYAVEQALQAGCLALGHSREFCRSIDAEPTALCWADKFCVFFDPMPFYFLRAWMTGELDEFKQHAQPHIGNVSARTWQLWYRGKVRTLVEEKCSLYYRDQIFRS